MDIQVAEGVGAYVHNIDLNTISTADADKLKKALGEYGVLFFRNQSLTEQNHIQFAEQFAPININRFFKAHADYPKIAEVLKEADQTGNIGSKWHTDHSYDQIPALGSILVARELPESGGDTIFASMFAAYDALDDAMKAKVEGLTAVHSSRHAFGVKAYDEKSREDMKGRLETRYMSTVRIPRFSTDLSGKRVLLPFGIIGPPGIWL